MITFINHMRVNPDNAAAFEEILTDVCAKVRENEPGAIHYSFAKSAKDPNTYVVIEVFRDETSVQAHADTDFIKASIPKASLLVEDGKIDVQRYVSAGAI